MTFKELQKEISQYIYMEDDGMTRIALASIIATRLKLGDPVWMLLIGASSSGKSQILRPLSLTDNKFIHRVDDLTENTLLSGYKAGKGQKDVSLLKRIGDFGIIVVSDLTVLFSKSSEIRSAVLGQLRMVYDGEMTKYSGNSGEPIRWQGYLGIVAGSTPSIYSNFEEVTDMGERFIYYRMKPYDIEKATSISMKRSIYGRELDEKLSRLYGEYVKDCVKNVADIEISKIELSEEIKERILKASMFASKLRTPVHHDKFKKEINKIPVSEMPMRVALQITTIAKSIMIMSYFDYGKWELQEDDIRYIEWCAYSLANEERRACLKVLAKADFGVTITTQKIADQIGLVTSVIGEYMNDLFAIGIVERTGDYNSLYWSIKDKSSWDIIRRMESITDYENDAGRGSSEEEDMIAIIEETWNSFKGEK